MNDATQLCHRPKCKVSNKQFSQTRFFAHILLKWGQFPRHFPYRCEICRYFCRFSRQVVTMQTSASNTANRNYVQTNQAACNLGNLQSCRQGDSLNYKADDIHSVSKKTSPMFLAMTRKSIVIFS